jgi:hypothetical protein
MKRNLAVNRINKMAIINANGRLHLENFLLGRDCDAVMEGGIAPVKFELVGQGSTPGKRLSAVCSNISANSVTGMSRLEGVRWCCNVLNERTRYTL